MIIKFYIYIKNEIGKIFLGRLHIWFLSFTLYFNLVPNFLIVLIWSLTFQCHVNSVTAIISLIEIAVATNGYNTKLAYCHINGN